MKFTMLSNPWPSVVQEVVDAGHEWVDSVEDAEFLIYNGGRISIPSNIQFVQWVFAGVEAIKRAGIMTPEVRWANAAGVFAKPVAEHAMALILASLHHYKFAFQNPTFDVRLELDDRQDWLFERKRVAIFGAGGIGKELIRMLAPFEPHITAVNRSGNPVDGADETLTMDNADWVWGEADIIVNILPLTEQTTGLIDASVFSKMKNSAYFINVGRGATVVTDDLVEALRSGQIAGAGLEVMDPEPLPENHPLWQLDNVVMTPHVAAMGSISQKLIGSTIIDNAAAFERGEKMPTEVDVESGY